MNKLLTPIIKDGFLQFAGAVLQSRALVDSRDCIKPSARQIFYCMFTDGFVHSKSWQKTLKSIGSTFRIYIHGDSSAEGVIMRAAQPFSMRYPLVEVEGSYGTLLASGSWAAPRYTSSRLTPLAEYLFKDVKKDTIDEWRDNYDNTEQYPSVLPSKGFFNLVNGSYGIGVGASASLPQYNLKELNEALIKLLWNKDISFDEIYVAPDFATGATILNGEEVKESHKLGIGMSCKIRSTIEFDSKDRCLVVTEIPYMVYTETICGQLEEIINGDNNPGIDKFNDLTGEKPLIKIYLSRGARPEKVLKFLYKNTALQSYYGVNFTLLENGRFPRTFGWKELLQSYLDHQILVYTRSFKFDLNKIESRILIIDGLLKAYDAIDEVIAAIKTSSSAQVANLALQKLLDINETQAKAILDMKLARLSKLDITKLVDEKINLEKEKSRIEAILSDDNLLKKEIENGLREVAEKFGDARRTKILNLPSIDDEEVVEEKQLIISLSNHGNIYTTESSTLMISRRGAVGNKIKLATNEYIIQNLTESNKSSVMLFSNKGRFYNYDLAELIDEKTSVFNLIKLSDDEKITKMISCQNMDIYKYIIFVTKHGLIKKSLLSEYVTKRATGAQGIKFKTDDDEVVSICFANDGVISLATQKGFFSSFNIDEINTTGKVTSGCKAINLEENDYIIGAEMRGQDKKEIVSITQDGLISKTDLSEFPITSRASKGIKVQKTDTSLLASFALIGDEKEIIVGSQNAILKMPLASITKTKRGAIGIKAIKLTGTNKVISLFI